MFTMKPRCCPTQTVPVRVKCRVRITERQNGIFTGSLRKFQTKLQRLDCQKPRIASQIPHKIDLVFCMSALFGQVSTRPFSIVLVRSVDSEQFAKQAVDTLVAQISGGSASSSFSPRFHRKKVELWSAVMQILDMFVKVPKL